MKPATAEVCPCGCGTPVRPFANRKERLLFIHSKKNMCNDCKQIFEDKDLVIDHIYPVCRGGSNDKTNWQVLCNHCNRRKIGEDRRKPHRGIQLILSNHT